MCVYSYGNASDENEFNLPDKIVKDSMRRYKLKPIFGA